MKRGLEQQRHLLAADEVANRFETSVERGLAGSEAFCAPPQPLRLLYANRVPACVKTNLNRYVLSSA